MGPVPPDGSCIREGSTAMRKHGVARCAAAGVVEHIAPMRTVLRADNKLPIYISNKVGCT